MADWAELPKELLYLIFQRLESPLYLIRFRSVCTSWRLSSFHSLSPLSSSTLSNIPIPSHHSIFLNNNFFLPLSYRTLFLIVPPDNHHRPWLIKLTQHPPRLYHPLSRSPIKRHRFLLDFYHLPVFHLGHEFVLTDTCPPNSLYMEKVVFASLGDVFLTIHVSGKLALFRCGDSCWTVIPDMPSPYDDVCVFEGRLYAVDSTGRTVSVGLDFCLGLVAEPVFGGDKKFLVECEGELLLVDKFLSSYYFCSSGFFEDYDDFDEDAVCEFGWERTVRFEVYRLDEKGKRWVELTTLGERVLFLGDDSAFSVSVRDLGVGKGNCVVFRDDALKANGVACGVGVFSFDDGQITPLSDFPGFSELFWPPPDWVGLH